MNQKTQSVKKEKPRKIDDILQSNVWDVDEEPHIVVDYEKCSHCKEKPCVYLCPAGCFTMLGDKILFSYEGCVECGTCRVVCPMKAIDWNHPRSGRGIHFRYG